MKCYICDGQVGPDEIKHTPEYGRGGFAPCGRCQEKIDEVFEHPDEEEIDNQISLELFYEEMENDNSNTRENSP